MMKSITMGIGIRNLMTLALMAATAGARPGAPAQGSAQPGAPAQGSAQPAGSGSHTSSHEAANHKAPNDNVTSHEAANRDLSRARQLMEQGVVEYERGDWEASRRSFEAVWKIREHWTVAGNLAEVEMRLGLYRKAARHLQYMLANLPTGQKQQRPRAQAQLQ